MLEVVLGPLTRLGRALMPRLPSGGELILVARSRDDEQRLVGAHPAATIVRADGDQQLSLDAYDEMRIHACALGPIHPDPAPVLDKDAERAAADLRLLSRLIEYRGEAAIHLLFVSSVLALASSRHRVYYAAWKRLLEAESLRLLSPRAHFSVIYPGRLVPDDARRTLRLIHTTYGSLADTLVALPACDSRHVVVGRDARAWLFRHRVVSALGLARRAPMQLPTNALAEAMRRYA